MYIYPVGHDDDDGPSLPIIREEGREHEMEFEDNAYGLGPGSIESDLSSNGSDASSDISGLR